MLHEELTKAIIGAFYKVHNGLGYGFLEKVYENALKYQLEILNLNVVSQAKIEVFYERHLVGEYYADLLVENCVVLELKTVEKLVPAHTAQLLNYLKATSIEVGLLLNFGPDPQVKRQIFTNDRKKHPPQNP